MLPGAQLYDLMCVLLLLAAVGVLSQIKPGVIYYWMKDITSEFLKIQVIFTALEILDKVIHAACRAYTGAMAAAAATAAVMMAAAAVTSALCSIGSALVVVHPICPCTEIQRCSRSSSTMLST
eukprot:GHUV01036719.1.p1 GENE.GHUV01036719.1~~GHUV01036719.1.p1  ORF type:complete len:123 (+),score=33.20 GHUV01036719.1:290-658(+)